MPRSPRPGGPPIVIGGNGPRRTLPWAARYADEWNAVFVTADEFAKL
jgi:alkanesulfonate monooxygenase SsuD/methylene tetrahydromethanopterin reductase-like flavin-dependent oxidoreductase (luciferase family)